MHSQPNVVDHKIIPQKMDSAVSRAVDRYADNLVASKAAKRSGADTEPEEVDVDELFEQLENEDDGCLREQRLQQLQHE
jgi:hypothetical protein